MPSYPPNEIPAGPAGFAAAVTPSDSTMLDRPTRGVYVGTTGNVSAIVGGSSVVFVGVPAGAVLPIAANRINSTNTTASNIVALW